MRNGLNTGNMSELVHEIRYNPKEAQFRYSVQSHVECSGKPTGLVQTLAGGSIRIARPFTIRTSAAGCTDNDTSAHEHLLLALGGCAMITLLLGCGARAVSLSRLEMELNAEVVRGAPLRNVRYCFRVHCDASPDTIASLARHVACFSPNHRTFIDGNDVQTVVGLTSSNGGEYRATLAAQNNQSCTSDPSVPVQAKLTWQYGTQIKASTALAGVERPQNLWVDQPKQALGLDRAPNPQEYLLAALNAEILQELSRVASSVDQSEQLMCVRSSGKLDLRGLLNVDATVPTRVHELNLDIEAKTSQMADAWIAHLERSLAASVVYQTICQSGSIEVTVFHNDRQIDAFTTDREFVSQQLIAMEQQSSKHKEQRP